MVCNSLADLQGVNEVSHLHLGMAVCVSWAHLNAYEVQMAFDYVQSSCFVLNLAPLNSLAGQEASRQIEAMLPGIYSSVLATPSLLHIASH